LFTTTIRNPERLKDFLQIFYQYDGEILNTDIIGRIARELIKKGLYQPTRVTSNIKAKWKQAIELDDAEVIIIFEDNPQEHKEAGFDRGWPSRFDTWFKFAKELGFVYYWQGEKIVFSESGKMLIDKEKPENEQMVFANAFAKYQRDNPFRRIKNKNIPLILLIETINHLNNDTQFNGTGISKNELPILLCWRDNNSLSLYEKIKEIRTLHGYTPSDEIILDVCDSLLDTIVRDSKSILWDYPDDFIRKMRLTGLISIRGGGRFIDINNKEIIAINFILSHYGTLSTYPTEKDFFNYIGTVDRHLIGTLTIFKASSITTKQELHKWVNHYDWNTIKREMIYLAEKKSSKDDILKLIEQPLRLEFLTTLAILKKIPNITVKPNFVSDDEGLPTSFASGGNPDIECSENNEKILVEVTLLTGTQQHIRESYSIQRHLEVFLEKGHNAFCLFISPKAFVDTCRNASYVKYQYNQEIKILDITLFVEQLEQNTTLRNVAYTATSCP
jgi:hypothetical protein